MPRLKAGTIRDYDSPEGVDVVFEWDDTGLLELGNGQYTIALFDPEDFIAVADALRVFMDCKKK